MRPNRMAEKLPVRLALPASTYSHDGVADFHVVGNAPPCLSKQDNHQTDAKKQNARAGVGH